jgi:ribosomal protein S1
MKAKLVLSLAAAFTMSLAANALAAGAKDYQVTGPVVELTDSKIVVQKGESEKSEKWEISRTADTKGMDGVKVGDKVTVKYTMTATSVENKSAAKAEKKEEPKAEKTAKTEKSEKKPAKAAK